MEALFKRYLSRFENLILGTTFLVMIVAMVTQVVNRTFVHSSMPWLEELAVYSMLYMVLLGTEAGLRDGSQLSIKLLEEKLKGRVRLVVEAIAKLVVLVFSVIMLRASYALVMQQVSSGQLTPALQWPMWIPYASFLIAFALIVVVQAVTLVLYVKALIRNDESIVRAVEDKPEDIEETIAKERKALLGADAGDEREGDR